MFSHFQLYVYHIGEAEALKRQPKSRTRAVTGGQRRDSIQRPFVNLYPIHLVKSVSRKEETSLISRTSWNNFPDGNQAGVVLDKCNAILLEGVCSSILRLRQDGIGP
jgi:hypothetical protein